MRATIARSEWWRQYVLTADELRGIRARFVEKAPTARARDKK